MVTGGSLSCMQPFASYVLRKYYAATGWNEDNLYSNLTRSSNAILDFQVPKGLHFHVSKAPNAMFNTTYSLNALPSLNGSVGYIFTSCDLQLESSTDVKLQEVVQRFRVYDQARSPEPRPEVWLAGERIDKRDYLMYGRLYVPTGRLDALYSTRLSSNWQFVAAAISEQRPQYIPKPKARRIDSPDHSNILLNLQHDRGKWCSEYTWSAIDGLWGARFLYNFGKRADEEASDKGRQRQKRIDEEEAMEGGLKGRISAGAELYFSAKEKSGGVSTALRFTTVPDATPPSGQLHEDVLPSQPPTTITAVLNPILGHISAAYATRVSRDLALSSRFDFNVYSYESEWTMGAEWWIRQPPRATDEELSVANDDSPGVLKARISTNYDVSIFWEGRLRQLLVGLGAVSDLGNRSRPIRALGVEVAYFS